jgi:hypothetical protein
MSFLFLSFFGFVALLLGFFIWSLRKPSQPQEKISLSAVQESTSRPNINFLPQIRQALGPADTEFLEGKIGRKHARRVRRERKAIVLAYLSALQSDFEKLLRQVTLIAVLSPEVVAMHEFERIRLSLEFSLRCKLIRCRIHLGFAAIPELSSLSDFVSGLTVRIESAMRELAERAATNNLSSPLNGGVNTV